MDGEGDDMFSNAGEAAKKDQTRILTLDQDQEGDGKEKKESDSDASLRDEIQGLQHQLDDARNLNRCLRNEIRVVECEVVDALNRNRCLTAEISRIRKMTKVLGTKVCDLSRDLSLSKEQDKTTAVKQLAKVSPAWEKVVEALEAAKARLEGELHEVQSEVGARDAATALMANALVVSRMVAAVLSVGAFAAFAAAFYFRNGKRR